MLVASSLALLSLLLPPVSIVSSAAIALVTLRRGGYEGLYVLVCACLSAAFLGLFLFGSFQFALLYGLVLWLPIWLISVILREGKHLSVAVEIAVFFGVASVIGFYLFVDNPALVWSSLINQMAPSIAENRTDVSLEEITKSIQFFSRYMTGGIVAGTVYGLLFSLFLARWWQSALYNPGGFREEYLSLRTHPRVALACLLILAAAYISSGVIAEICWNITILFVVLFTIIGTAVLHASFSTMKKRRFLVPFLYITLLLMPHVIAFVALVGVIDSWLDLRNRFLNKTKT